MQELRAGPLTALLDGADVRRVCRGGVELVRRIGVAVRDGRWSTVPGVVERCEVEVGRDSFAIALAARHRSDALDARWDGQVEGTADGDLAYRIAWTAVSDFLFSRIGLVVLHPPATCAGRPVRARTETGWLDTAFDHRVGPQPFADGHFHALLPPFSELRLRLDEGELAFAFSGDLFEIEDHRNWTDASFKTYGTPLARPLPQRAAAGEQRRQALRVALRPHRGAGVPPAARDVGASGGATIGSVGVTHAEAPLGDAAVEVLRALRLGHLRIDVDLEDPAHVEALGAGLRAADRVGCAVELALHVTAVTAGRLYGALSAARAARVARVHVLPGDAAPAGPWASTQGWLAEAGRAALADAGLGVPLVGGTPLSFAELNRTRPDVDGLDGVCYGFNPQVHGIDDATVVENLQAQADTVESARAIAGGRAVFVGPVALAPPPHADPRQSSLLAAGWTLGTLAALFGAGAAAVTLYETLGPRGLMTADDEPLAHPLLHVLTDVAELAGGRVLEWEEAPSEPVVGLAVEREGRRHVLLANLSAQPCAWPLAGAARVRRLNEETARAALATPVAWRRTRVACSALQLAPYEYVRID